MRHVVLLGILVAAGGCRSMESVKADTDGGTTRIYSGSVAEMLTKSEEILKAEGGESFEREESAVFCNFPANVVHSGTYAGVWVKEDGPGKVSVRCVTMRRMAHQVGCALSEKSFHELLTKKTSQETSK